MSTWTEFPEPVKLFEATQTALDLYDHVNGLLAFSHGTNEPVIQWNGQWFNLPMYAQSHTKYEGDVLSWDGTQWRPASNIDILGYTKAKRFLTLADSTIAYEARRTYKDLTPTITGNGDMDVFGDHIYAANTDIQVVIDTAGSPDDGTSTFKWSNDGGSTFEQTLQPLTVKNRIHLENGLYVQFFPGDYDANDTWDFVAIGTASQLYDFKIDTTNSQCWVGNKLIIANDETFELAKTAGIQTLNFAGNGSLAYNTANNEFALNYSPDEYIEFAPAGMTFALDSGDAITFTQSNNELLLDVGTVSLTLNPSGSAGTIALSATSFNITGLQTISGSLDVAGYAAIGDSVAVSTTTALGIDITKTSSGTWRGLNVNTALTINANSTVLTPIRTSGTVTGTGFSSLTLQSITADTQVLGGTYNNVIGLRSAVVFDGTTPPTVTNFRGLHVVSPGNPAGISLNAYGINVEVPQGANWVTRVGMFLTAAATGDELYRNESTATNDDVRQTFKQARVATTDATVTALHVSTVDDDHVVLFVAHVVARQTGGTAGTVGHGAGYRVQGTFRATAGAATLIGASGVTAQEDNAVWNMVWVAAGGNAELRVTGEADKSIVWHANIWTYRVAS